MLYIKRIPNLVRLLIRGVLDCKFLLLDQVCDVLISILTGCYPLSALCYVQTSPRISFALYHPLDTSDEKDFFFIYISLMDT